MYKRQVLCLSYWVKRAKRDVKTLYDDACRKADAVEVEGYVEDERE